jgi:hypothetical protein
VIIALALALFAVPAANALPQAKQQASGTSRNCADARRLLIGAWSMQGVDSEPSEIFPNGDSREFQFVVEEGRQVWREYIHFRPGTDGRWEINGCRVTVIDRYSGWRENYDVVRLNRSHLWLRPAGTREIERWTRITS